MLGLLHRLDLRNDDASATVEGVADGGVVMAGDTMVGEDMLAPGPIVLDVRERILTEPRGWFAPGS